MIIKHLLAIAIVAVASLNLHAQTLLSTNQRSLEKTKAEHWMKNFQTLKGGTLAYLYGKQVLNELASTKGTTGAYIFRALDNGKETIVFKPVNQDGVMFKGLAFEDGTQCPPYCTPCSEEPCNDNNAGLKKIGRQIDESLAVEMIEKYRAVNPNQDAFLLERESLKSILNWRGVEAIYFANALDDLGEQHLVLIGVDQQRQLLWDGPVYYLDKTSLPDYPHHPVAQTK